jgi:hypothetical protein
MMERFCAIHAIASCIVAKFIVRRCVVFGRGSRHCTLGIGSDHAKLSQNLIKLGLGIVADMAAEEDKPGVYIPTDMDPWFQNYEAQRTMALEDLSVLSKALPPFVYAPVQPGGDPGQQGTPDLAKEKQAQDAVIFAWGSMAFECGPLHTIVAPVIVKD